MATMTMRLHKGKTSLLGFAIFVLTFAVCAMFIKSKTSIFIGAQANPFYSPQISRNAEWTGPGKTPYSADSLQKIASDNGYAVIEKYVDNFNIQNQFTAARSMVAAAKSVGNANFKVMQYYNTSFWYSRSVSGWKPYSDSFNQDWLIKDASGKPIPFYGLGNNPDSSTAIGYVYDLSNPDYRAWAVTTISDWMRQAPYKGIAFDSANPLIGTVVRATVGDGKTTWNDLLCGAGAATDSSGNCARVNAWNAGMVSLLSQATAAVHSLGGEVLYNGVAASLQRDSSRNVGLMQYTDMALNENFCLASSIPTPDQVVFKPLVDDITMMQQQAASGKKIFETTNFQTTNKIDRYGGYCQAGFMMGWQPGYDYSIAHLSYTDPLTDAYPKTPETNLNLGNPITQYDANGSILSRSFQNGFVAVNNSDSSATYTLPVKLVQFSNGTQGSTYAAGSQLTLPARSGAFFLNDSYVNPATGNTGSSGTGSRASTNLGTTGVSTSSKVTSKNETQITGNVAANGDLSGGIDLKTPAIDGVTKVEYYIDGKLVRTVIKFPDSGEIDTTEYSNGKHVLLTKYYHSDGTVTTAVKSITINNPNLRNKTVSVIKHVALPSLGIVVLLAVIFYIFHRFKFLIPRWFYRHDASPKDGPKPAPAVYHPGVVIAPSNPNEKDTKE